MTLTGLGCTLDNFAALITILHHLDQLAPAHESEDDDEETEDSNAAHINSKQRFLLQRGIWQKTHSFHVDFKVIKDEIVPEAVGSLNEEDRSRLAKEVLPSLYARMEGVIANLRGAGVNSDRVDFVLDKSFLAV